MNEKKHGIGHNIRQAVLVTVVLLVLCGLVFPVLLSGLSAVIFPSQAKGSLVTADGIAVGAKNVGQDFTEDYFMWCRPSAYNYNTYYEEDTDGDGQVEQYYNDDLSLAEIADNFGITRQGVRDSIKRGEGIILDLEQKVGFAARYRAVQQGVAQLESLARSIRFANSNSYSPNAEIERDVDQMLEEIRRITD